MLNKPRKQRAGTSKASATMQKQSQVSSKKHLGVHTLSRYLSDVNDPQEKPFLDYSEAEMKSKIERLYRKTVLPPEPVVRRGVEIDPEEKDKRDKERYLKQRDRISKRLKELEKTKPFKSEIELKEERLTEVRQEHDQLHYELERNRKKLADLSEQHSRFVALHGGQNQDTDLETIRYDLAEIEQARVVHELASDQLKHMFLAYKADILIQQESMQRLKEDLRLGRTKKERLNKEFENLSKECDKYWGKIVGVADQNEIGEQGVSKEGLPGEGDLDREVIMLQGRSAWQNIEVEEEKMELEEKKRLAAIKARKDKQVSDKLNGEYKTLLIRHHNEKRRHDSKLEDVKKLQEELRIGREDEIIDTYRELLGNREKIKEITANYKQRVEEVEEEIKTLQEEYKRQKFEVRGVESRYDDPAHVGKIVEVIQAHEREFGEGGSRDSGVYSEELAKLRQKLVGYVKQSKEQAAALQADEGEAYERLKNKSDLDALSLLEQQFSDSFKELFKKELEMKRMSSLVNSACTTVSRIMYQLDRNVACAQPEREELRGEHRERGGEPVAGGHEPRKAAGLRLHQEQGGP